LSGLLLLRIRYLDRTWHPTVIIWSAVTVGAILATAALALTLGSYPPALQAIERNPELFTTIRGGVRSLFDLGIRVVLLGHLILLVREGVAGQGVVPRSWLLGFAGLAALAIGAGMTGFLQPPLGGVVAFLIPTLLGGGLWRAGRHRAM
jgi:hypothetical protein